jgi:hypothetical protein
MYYVTILHILPYTNIRILILGQDADNLEQNLSKLYLVNVPDLCKSESELHHCCKL